MRIIGFNLLKILIERKENFEGELKIDQNIDIKDIIKEKVPISTDEALRVKFKFVIDYSKNSAKLEFEGFVILLPEKEELKEFLDSWKDKKIPEKSKIPLFNFIMTKCNVKALSLEDDLALPTHIPMPRLNPEDTKENKSPK